MAYLSVNIRTNTVLGHKGIGKTKETVVIRKFSDRVSASELLRELRMNKTNLVDAVKIIRAVKE